MRRRPLLVSALLGAGLLVSACGRSGFPDDELGPVVDTGSSGDSTLETTADGGDTGSFETEVPPFDEGIDSDFDTGVLFDTDLPPDSIVVLDSIVGEDTAAFDTAGFDTAVIDTGVVDRRVRHRRDRHGRSRYGSPRYGRHRQHRVRHGFDTGFDTGFDAPPDTPTDTPIEGGITCGATTCDGLTQDCCASFTGLSCVPKGKCTGGGTLSCSDSTSCPTGQVCCFGGLGGGGGPSAKCAPVCAGIQLCKTSAECKAPNTCQPVFGGFRVCR